MTVVQDQKKEKRRRAIIRAALRVFARKGYETTALDEVAREADLAKGTLYLYFKDKEDLYLQVMLDVLERLGDYVRRQIEGMEDPLDRMETLARSQIAFLGNNPNYFRLFRVAFTPEMATIHKKLLEPLYEKRRQLGQLVHSLVEEGKENGRIRGDIDTRDVVLSYIGMVTQTVQSTCLARLEEQRAAERSVSPKAKARAIMKILLHGIAVEDTTVEDTTVEDATVEAEGGGHR